MIVGGVWNIPVTTADTRVGDADVSGRYEGGVTTLSSLREYPPFLGRRVDIHTGIARGKPVRTVLGGFRSPGRTDQGIPEERGSLHGKSCWRGRRFRILRRYSPHMFSDILRTE